MNILEFYNKVDNSVGVAKIIFNQLSKTYPVKKISEIAKTTSGGTPNRAISSYYGGEIPWIKSGELNDGLITTYEETINEEGLKNSSAKIYPKGTLVLALYGATVGKTGILDFQSASNQAVCAVFPEKEINKEYLFWFFRQNRLEYLHQSFGGAQPNISQEVVKNTLIPVPPVEVQNDVQKYLFQIEKTKQILNNNRFSPIMQKLQGFIKIKQGSDNVQNIYLEDFESISNLRKAILQEAVTGKLVPQNQGDEPDSELLKNINLEKETPFVKSAFNLPKGWSQVRFSDIISLRHGHQFMRHDFVKSGIPVVKIGECKAGLGLDLSSCDFIAESRLNEFKEDTIHEGDVLMALTGGTLGKVTLVDKDYGIIVQNYRVGNFFPINEKILSKDYLIIILKSNLFQDLVKGKINQNAQPNIGKANIEKLLIPLPPFSEQRRIIVKVNHLMDLCDSLEAQIMESQKNSEILMGVVLREAFSS